MISLEYLDDERKKLWEKLISLEKDIIKKTPEYEKEAKSSSKKASEYRNKCNQSREIADEYVLDIKNKLTEVDKLLISIKESEGNSSEKSKEIDTILIASNENLKVLNDRKLEIQESIEHLEEVLVNHPDLEDEIESLNSAFQESEDVKSKILILHKNSLAKKKEIDTLYYEIVGYTHKDEETEEEEEIEGLKQKLDKTYNELETNFGKIKLELSQVHKKTILDFENFIINKDEFFEKKLINWSNKYESIEKKINSLLPNALTAGLSSAYSSKKIDEEKEQTKLVTRFNWGIFGLILVSLIPFAVSIKSISEGLELEQVIIRMPRLVLAILPLYIPVMWVAYSANRKMNLSKRLIEEYSHKEVISKTFEGLSKQINDIEDSETSADLKLKLLYNILEVSGENPGKLISNYNKSDHPIMDALDKSVKLSNAVEKLKDIPGLSSLSKVLNKKSKKILDVQAEKVAKVFEDIEEETEEEEA